MFVNKVLLYTNIPIYFYFIFCFFTTQMTMLNTARTRFIWCLAFDWTTNLCRVPNSLIQLWRGGRDQQASPLFTDLETVVKRLTLHVLSGILQIGVGKSLNRMLWAFQTHRHSLGTGKSPCTRIGTRPDGRWSNTCPAVRILRNPQCSKLLMWRKDVMATTDYSVNSILCDLVFLGYWWLESLGTRFHSCFLQKGVCSWG